ncbi:MAG TPA: DUF6075 family protein [Mobilitalea sp.]|nr:DUF6075 family protein [Mobilitalea sp.]
MFLNEQHKQNYIKICKQRFGKEWTNDSEYASAFFILSMPEMYNRCRKYVLETGINFKEIIGDSTFSNSEMFLIRVAFNLYTSGKEMRLLPDHIRDSYYKQLEDYVGVNLSDVVNLGEDYYKVFLQLLEIRRGEIPTE